MHFRPIMKRWFLALLLGLAVTAARPSAAEMMINFAGEGGTGDGTRAPITGSFLFDPQPGSVTTFPNAAVFSGNVSASVDWLGQTFTFGGLGQVQIADKFPQNLLGSTDADDQVSVRLFTPTESIRIFEDSFSQDFIHGTSLTQSFDIVGTPGLDVGSSFDDGFIEPNGQLSPGFLSVGIGVHEVSMHPVPEPGTFVMLLTALGGLLWLRRRTAGQAGLLGASAAVIAGFTCLSAPASATMLISFTGSSLLTNGERAPMSGQIMFDPAAGTITSGSAESQYIGPIQGNVTFEGQNFVFPGQGHVRLWDDFPINHNEFEGAFDQIDVGFFSLDPTHVDFLHINANKVEDFVHGLAFTQSFDVLDPDSEPQNEFLWDFVSGHPQPDTINVEMRLDEVSMHPVPEPGSLLMLLTALGGLLGLRYRRSLMRLSVTALGAVALTAGGLGVTPSSATEMVISFTGTATDLHDSGTASISGQMMFDPAAGSVGISPTEPAGQYLGPMSEIIQLGSRTFSATSDIGGHVRLADRYPVDLSDTEPSADVFSAGLLGGTPGNLQINVGGATDFIHGASFTQSFDVHNIGSWDFPNEFDWDQGQSDAVAVTFDITELSMHPASVPEPGSLVILVTALGGLGWMSRRHIPKAD